MISLDDIPPYIGAASHVECVSGRRLAGWVHDHAENDGYDLDPDFQRGHVWADALRSAFVEHLLRGGMHGRTLVWNSPTYEPHGTLKHRDLPDTLVLVDGKQRYTAVTRFLAGEVTVFGGHRYEDFDDDSKQQMGSATGQLRMFMNVHSLQFRRQLLDLYLQMNEGAVAHDPAEIARVKALRDQAAIPGDRA